MKPAHVAVSGELDLGSCFKLGRRDRQEAKGARFLGGSTCLAHLSHSPPNPEIHLVLPPCRGQHQED